MKQYFWAGITVIVLFFIFLAVSEISQSGQNKEKVKNLEMEKIKNDESTKEIKKTFQRKVINKSFSSDTNFEWLRQNICADC